MRILLLWLLKREQNENELQHNKCRVMRDLWQNYQE